MVWGAIRSKSPSVRFYVYRRVTFYIDWSKNIWTGLYIYSTSDIYISTCICKFIRLFTYNLLSSTDFEKTAYNNGAICSKSPNFVEEYNYYSVAFCV